MYRKQTFMMLLVMPMVGISSASADEPSYLDFAGHFTFLFSPRPTPSRWAENPFSALHLYRFPATAAFDLPSVDTLLRGKGFPQMHGTEKGFSVQRLNTALTSSRVYLCKTTRALPWD